MIVMRNKLESLKDRQCNLTKFLTIAVRFEGHLFHFFSNITRNNEFSEKYTETKLTYLVPFPDGTSDGFSFARFYGVFV
jgi:primosomal protein N''